MRRGCRAGDRFFSKVLNIEDGNNRIWEGEFFRCVFELVSKSKVGRRVERDE